MLQRCPPNTHPHIYPCTKKSCAGGKGRWPSWVFQVTALHVKQQAQPFPPLTSPAHRPHLQLNTSQVWKQAHSHPPWLPLLSVEEGPTPPTPPKVVSEGAGAPTPIPKLSLSPAPFPRTLRAPSSLICTIQDRRDRSPGLPGGMSAPGLTPHPTPPASRSRAPAPLGAHR